MKCDACTSELPINANFCPHCGVAVAHPKWPELPAFEGRPILRGVAWFEGGTLFGSDGAQTLPVLELRDGAEPINLRIDRPERVILLENDHGSASAKILVRPDGIRVCVAPGLRPPGESDDPVYQTVVPAQRIWLDRIVIRVLLFSVPRWVEAS